MKWSTFKGPVLIAIVVIGGGLILINRHCARIDLEAEKKRHKNIVDKIIEEKEALIEERDRQNKTIDRIFKELKEERGTREKRDKEIKKLQSEIKKIPKRTVPFKKLTECQKKHDKLQEEHEKLWGLKIKLELQLDSHKKDEGKIIELQAEVENLREINVNLEEKNKSLHEEHQRHQKVIYGLAKPSIFYFGFGGHYDPLKNTFGVSLQMGLNLTGIIKSLF